MQRGQYTDCSEQRIGWTLPCLSDFLLSRIVLVFLSKESTKSSSCVILSQAQWNGSIEVNIAKRVFLFEMIAKGKARRHPPPAQQRDFSSASMPRF